MPHSQPQFWCQRCMHPWPTFFYIDSGNLNSTPNAGVAKCSNPLRSHYLRIFYHTVTYQEKTKRRQRGRRRKQDSVWYPIILSNKPLAKEEKGQRGLVVFNNHQCLQLWKRARHNETHPSPTHWQSSLLQVTPISEASVVRTGIWARAMALNYSEVKTQCIHHARITDGLRRL